MIRPTKTPPSQWDGLDELIEQACEADPLPLLDEVADAPRGPPLSLDECRDAQIRLATFQAASDFAKLTKVLCDRCNSEDWFNRPHLKFLHDAYVLAEFVQLTSVQQVRLADASDQWPDGYVKVGAKIHNIEITSTHGGRKLGQEYRGIAKSKMDPVEDWVARAESIPHHLDAVIRAKQKKRYGSPCWLVVYLNISEWGIRQVETEKVIGTIKARFAESFGAIWVLWKQKLY